MFKINNSYDTEPATSNSSSSNDGAPSSSEWDFTKESHLKDFLFPSETLTFIEEMKCKKVSYSPVVSSSQESDFCGFSPTIGRRNKIVQENRKRDESIVKECHGENSIVRRTIGLTECGSAQTINSEEFSDQDIRCRIEIEKDIRRNGRTEDNASQCNVSRFSIEPDTSDEEDQQPNLAPLKIYGSSSNLPTLSVNENSNNAVDNAISITSYKIETEPTDLSFNGKLKARSTNLMTDAMQSTSNKSTGNENKDDFKDLNPNDESNLEWQLQLETSREHINERSPDLFSDDDDDDLNADKPPRSASATVDVIDSAASIKCDEKDEPNNCLDKTEKLISKRLQNLLSGILPPPSFTYIQHDISNLVSMYKRNVALMDSTSLVDENPDDKAISDPIPIKPKIVDNVEWPKIRSVNAHGLHYNRTKYTENIEMMYMKLVERNVGQEMGSSFTSNISVASKKKPIRKLMASPGNRLSHLARRRAIFSSAHLQSQSQLSNLSKLGRKTCVIDASKLSRKEKVATPKRRVLANRRTPGRKTPSSLKKSATKLVTIVPKCGTATRETSKRALFLSPTQDEGKNAVSLISTDMSRRVEKSKRALFSPPHRLERSMSNISTNSNTSCSTSHSAISNSTKKTHFDMMASNFNRTSSDVSASFKRRLETDGNENMEPYCSKFQRTVRNSTLVKAKSENSMYKCQQLSASHKQKLLWAVSTALNKKSITSKHASFNQYASILGKVVKRLYLESLSSKAESTSATMSRIADRLVFWVLKGKSVDEIYFEEKARMDHTKNASKPLSGYINRDDYLKLEMSEKLNSSIHSGSGDHYSASNENDTNSKPLTNSSSKSNVGTSALRENHDSKSAQKSNSNVSFSGRNQKNLSPYNDKSRSMSNLNKITKLMPATNSNILKVKRQISFDS